MQRFIFLTKIDPQSEIDYQTRLAVGKARIKLMKQTCPQVAILASYINPSPLPSPDYHTFDYMDVIEISKEDDAKGIHQASLAQIHYAYRDAKAWLEVIEAIEY